MSQVSEISVLVSDLEVLRAALNSAYHGYLAQDLADQYRKLSVRPQNSPMTKALDEARAKVEALLGSVEEEEDELPGE